MPTTINSATTQNMAQDLDLEFVPDAARADFDFPQINFRQLTGLTFKDITILAAEDETRGETPPPASITTEAGNVVDTFATSPLTTLRNSLPPVPPPPLPVPLAPTSPKIPKLEPAFPSAPLTFSVDFNPQIATSSAPHREEDPEKLHQELTDLHEASVVYKEAQRSYQQESEDLQGQKDLSKLLGILAGVCSYLTCSGAVISGAVWGINLIRHDPTIQETKILLSIIVLGALTGCLALCTLTSYLVHRQKQRQLLQLQPPDPQAGQRIIEYIQILSRRLNTEQAQPPPAASSLS